MIRILNVVLIVEKGIIVVSYRCMMMSCVVNNGIFYEFKVKEK